MTELTGNVDVQLGTREIQADQLTYEPTTTAFNVSGTVRFQDPTVLIQGGNSATTATDGSSFNHAGSNCASSRAMGPPSRSRAQSGQHTDLRQVTYTSCPAPRTDWQIRARELVLDTNTSRGVGHGATVDFEGVPIVYLPWISFPLNEARQSGFLFPDLGTSGRSGASLGVPLVLEHCSHQDATFTPTYYTLRGAALGTEYRFLTEDSHGTLVANYLPSDRAYGSERNSVVALDQTQLGWNTRVDVVAESVSDTEYFEDFTPARNRPARRSCRAASRSRIATTSGT